MRASTLARSFVLLTLAAAAPAFGAGQGACEHALAKASAKFVGAAFKSAQRCLTLRGAGKLPAASCQLSAESTGDAHTDAALAHAESRLRQGIGACSDAVLATMGFDASCPDGASGASFGRGDLQHCIAGTHMRAVQALVSVQFPQETSTCGDGVVDPLEDCDPAANPTDCLEGEICVPAGSPDECTCIEGGSTTCGDGTKDASEACDPAAVPTGCPAGMTCGAAARRPSVPAPTARGASARGRARPRAEPARRASAIASAARAATGRRKQASSATRWPTPAGARPA